MTTVAKTNTQAATVAGLKKRAKRAATRPQRLADRRAKQLSSERATLTPHESTRITKDGFGRYILGDPQQGALAGQVMGGLDPSQNLFGLNVVPTTNIALGTFLVGSGSPVACEIMDRMETQVDISTEHSTFFTQNLVAIRAEKRLALITRRPGSFVTGTFNTSP